MLMLPDPRDKDPVMLHDDFEATLFKWPETMGTNRLVGRDTTEVYSGEASMTLQTNQVAFAIDDYALVSRYIEIPNVAGVCKFRCVFMTSASGTYVDHFTLYFKLKDSLIGRQIYDFRIQYDSESEVWQILVTGDVWQDMPALPKVTFTDVVATRYWQSIELVFDLQTQYYVSCRYLKTEVDLGQYHCDTSSASSLNYFNIGVKLKKLNDAARPNRVWIDDVLLTSMDQR